MKVIQVNCVYANGSTGKLVSYLHHYLQKKDFESIVYYGRGERSKEPNALKVCSELYGHFNHFVALFTGLMYGQCFLSTRKLERLIAQEHPDVVHLHCINGYFVNIYEIVTWLKQKKIKTVLTLHAEFMYTGSCGYSLECQRWKSGCGNCPRPRQASHSLIFDRTDVSWHKMYNAFKGFNDGLVVTSVSPWLMDRAKQSPILADKEHYVVYNGVDCDVFHYNRAEEILKKHGLNGKSIIFHATPNFSMNPANIKGSRFVVEIARRLRNDNVAVLVAGPYDNDFTPENNMVMLGQVKNQELLAKYYSISDCTLLTSEKETFSMVTAESLCCGTPVVGFEAGGPEQIAISSYSRFCHYGDVDTLEANVRHVLNTDIDKPKIAHDAKVKYSKESMCREYVEIYNLLCSDRISG